MTPNWPERTLFTHVGRWPRGKAGEAKFEKCAVRDSRFALVNNSELYDLRADPGQKTNVISAHADIVAAMRAAYDKWWDEVVPMLVNEDAVGPAENPFKELYRKQFGSEKTSPQPANSEP